METRKLNPSHDTALTIFVGASSKATNWENKETTWSQYHQDKRNFGAVSANG